MRGSFEASRITVKRKYIRAVLRGTVGRADARELTSEGRVETSISTPIN